MMWVLLGDLIGGYRSLSLDRWVMSVAGVPVGVVHFIPFPQGHPSCRVVFLCSFAPLLPITMSQRRSTGPGA